MAENTIANRTLFIADNLDVLRGMNGATVDLIYLDPPFNSGRAYRAPVGSVAAGAAFKDAWTLDDVDANLQLFCSSCNSVKNARIMTLEQLREATKARGPRVSRPGRG